MLPLHHRDTGALGRIRTAHLLITNQLLYQMSYKGKLGGDEWNRATNLLRMKELHYRCATSPLLNVLLCV